MAGRLHPFLTVLLLTAGLLACADPARAQESESGYDVVIAVDEQSVTYNGEAVDGLNALEEALVEDVQADPALTVKVLAHDTVPMEYVTKIVEAVRQYEVDCSVEMVSSMPGHDDNM